MKGERTLDDKPFRYGGICHNYNRTTEEWAEFIPQMRKCYICGGKMGNIYSPSGTLLKKTYPYVGVFHITKGENKGKSKFRPMCRACAYDFGRGVIELRENVHGIYGPIVVCRVDGEDFASLKGTEILDLARKDFAE